MSDRVDVLLQLCPLLPEIQAILDSRHEVHRWPAPDLRKLWLQDHAADVRAVVTGGQQGIDPALAAQLTGLRIIAINGVGYDRVDLDLMRRAGVRVTNTPDVLTDDVADLAIALLLNVMRGLPAAENHVRAGHWPAGDVKLGRRASGLRYGIVGLGRIGLAIATRLRGFGGTIAYTGPTRKDVSYAYHAELASLAEWSDVLFVATAASARTRCMIDRPILEALGPNGVLINIARGSIVDEPAMAEALAQRRLGAAGLDVFSDEPSVPDLLRDLPNVALAPHIGSATIETRRAMGLLMLENLRAFFAGEPLPSAVV